jgi:hypothetical protein
MAFILRQYTHLKKVFVRYFILTFLRRIGKANIPTIKDQILSSFKINLRNSFIEKVISELFTEALLFKNGERTVDSFVFPYYSLVSRREELTST